MSERNLVAVSIKHTEYRWKFGKPCILWGHRTKDDESGHLEVTPNSQTMQKSIRLKIGRTAVTRIANI